MLGQVAFDRAHPRFPFVAALPQSRTETLLAERLQQLAPGALRRDVALESLHASDDHMRATGRAEQADAAHAAVVEERARFVIGADGARSAVRELLGIAAPVHDYPDTYVMGDFADTGREPVAFVHLEPDGVVEAFPLPGGMRRYVVHAAHPAEPSAAMPIPPISQPAIPPASAPEPMMPVTVSHDRVQNPFCSTPKGAR